MYNEKIYLVWIFKDHYLWWHTVNNYKFNLKRSFVFFTEDQSIQDEYLEFSRKYLKGATK